MSPVDEDRSERISRAPFKGNSHKHFQPSASEIMVSLVFVSLISTAAPIHSYTAAQHLSAQRGQVALADWKRVWMGSGKGANVSSA